MSDDEGESGDGLAGRIIPDPDGGAPIFEVIGRREDHKVATIGVPNVRPCDHVSGSVTYILDEKWSTVACSKCKTQIPAFDVLLRFSEWNARHRSDREAADRSQRDLHVSRMRYLVKLKGITDQERTELKAAILDAYRTTPRALGKLVDKVEDSISDRRRAVADKRNPVKGHLPPTRVFHA